MHVRAWCMPVGGEWGEEGAGKDGWERAKERIRVNYPAWGPTIMIARDRLPMGR